MKKIFHVYLEDFEGEMFFDEHGAYLYGWSCNDANWRNEYMKPLMMRLGFEVISIFEPNLHPEIY